MAINSSLSLADCVERLLLNNKLFLLLFLDMVEEYHVSRRTKVVIFSGELQMGVLVSLGIE